MSSWVDRFYQQNDITKRHPHYRFRRARQVHHCDNCHCELPKGELYVDPMESNPERAGGYGGYRYCFACALKDSAE